MKEICVFLDIEDFLNIDGLTPICKDLSEYGITYILSVYGERFDGFYPAKFGYNGVSNMLYIYGDISNIKRFRIKFFSIKRQRELVISEILGEDLD
jgi:hypothetical protein